MYRFASENEREDLQHPRELSSRDQEILDGSLSIGMPSRIEPYRLSDHNGARGHAAMQQRIDRSPRVAAQAKLSAVARKPLKKRTANGYAMGLPARHLPANASVGQKLPESVQQKMESFFQTSFADVRIHVGQQAPTIGALAYAQGSNLHFAPGQYNPHSAKGQQLLGHELTHVVQQRAGRVRGSDVAVAHENELEHEANEKGRRAAAYGFIGAQPQLLDPQTNQISQPVIQCKGDAEEVRKRGRSVIATAKAKPILRQYLDPLNDAEFIMGLVSSEFSLGGLIASLKALQDNDQMQPGITKMLKDTFRIDEPYNSILNDRQKFASGRASELQGLTGELLTAQHLLKQGKTVNDIGSIERMSSGTQEVDLTVTHDGTKYFVEVAATPSKLRDKIKAGLNDTTNSQLARYRVLQSEREGSEIAYSCPTMTATQVSEEFLAKLKEANVKLVIRGNFYAPDEIAALKEEESEKQAAADKRHADKFTGQTPGDRRRAKKKKKRQAYGRRFDQEQVGHKTRSRGIAAQISDGLAEYYSYGDYYDEDDSDDDQ